MAWVDDPAITDDDTLPMNLRHLAGDFFCAPFGTGDIEDAPPHGWPANSAWHLVDSAVNAVHATALYRLCRTVLGAAL